MRLLFCLNIVYENQAQEPKKGEVFIKESGSGPRPKGLLEGLTAPPKSAKASLIASYKMPNGGEDALALREFKGSQIPLLVIATTGKPFSSGSLGSKGGMPTAGAELHLLLCATLRASKAPLQFSAAEGEGQLMEKPRPILFSSLGQTRREKAAAGIILALNCVSCDLFKGQVGKGSKKF
ncbi:hypothetical protein E2320_006724 [Naja naja]|nr:hypothetical protein E2320_006724 [Naja naja]